MRLTELINRQEPVIEEAARFGGREKQEVMSRIGKFRFGLEYEFNVSDRFGAINYLDSLEDNPERAEFSLKIDGHLSVFSKGFYAANQTISLEDLMLVRDTFKDAQNGSLEPLEAFYVFEEDRQQYQIWVNSVIRVISASMSMIKIENRLVNIKGAGLFKNFDAQTINLVKRLSTAIGKVNDTSPSIVIESFIDDFVRFADVWEQYLKREVILYRRTESERRVHDILDAIIMSWYDENVKPTRSNVGVPTKVDWVNDNLTVDKRYIEKVVPDVTVPNGVEVVTHPLPFRETVEAMNQLFDFIDQVGGTDQSTGLHCNVSYNGESFRNMNPVKAMTLIDDYYMMEGNGESDILRWEKRSMGAVPNHSIFLQKDVNGDTKLHHLAKTYVMKGAEAFIKEYEDVLLKYGKSEKYISFNIRNFLDGDVSEKRVEWRVMGSTLYNRRKNTIVNDMLHVCYVILAGMDHDFLRREYLQSIIRMLNKIAKHGKLESFVDIVGYYR